MIKKYIEFINEGHFNGFNSLGEWVESLIDYSYIQNIITRYTKGSDLSINLSNAINVLDDKEQQEIKAQIDHYLENGIEEKEPQLLASTDLEPLTESEISVAGKGIFTSFLKSLTGLGHKESQPNWERCPESFLLYYHFSNIQSEDLKQIF